MSRNAESTDEFEQVVVRQSQTFMKEANSGIFDPSRFFTFDRRKSKTLSDRTGEPHYVFSLGSKTRIVRKAHSLDRHIILNLDL